MCPSSFLRLSGVLAICFIFLRTVLLSSGCVIEGQHQTKLEDSQSGRWQQKEALGVKEESWRARCACDLGRESGFRLANADTCHLFVVCCRHPSICSRTSPRSPKAWTLVLCVTLSNAHTTTEFQSLIHNGHDDRIK